MSFGSRSERSLQLKIDPAMIAGLKDEIPLKIGDFQVLCEFTFFFLKREPSRMMMVKLSTCDFQLLS